VDAILRASLSFRPERATPRLQEHPAEGRGYCSPTRIDVHNCPLTGYRAPEQFLASEAKKGVGDKGQQDVQYGERNN
jgi:hypothetical protein